VISKVVNCHINRRGPVSETWRRAVSVKRAWREVQLVATAWQLLYSYL